ncbi:MAG: hypothetical protein KAU49_04580, partial [Candidatus Krumholzibacteria bacterium]|nr:hypothetical protein [Candidatus Krumholzibacteria bacterium]
ILGTEIERAARRVGMMIDMASSPFNGEFGKEYLYIVTHHKFEPPASLIRLSLDDGSYKTFFHKGVLRKMSARDIDGDGRSELLLLGYNVLLDAPVIIALDPDHVGGSSPSGACYNVSGLFQDIAKYYIKLPIYHRFVKFNYINYPLHINYFSSDKDLGVIVSSREEDVIYTISDSLVFTGAEVVREDANAGTISTVTYPEVEMDMKRLYRAVLYWDGEGWVAEPTVNRSYLKHVREGG